MILGWLGEPTIREILNPIFQWIQLPLSLKHIIPFIIAFYCHNLFPCSHWRTITKNIAIHKKEEYPFVFCSHRLILFHKLMYPFIWILNLFGPFCNWAFSESQPAHDMIDRPFGEETAVNSLAKL